MLPLHSGRPIHGTVVGLKLVPPTNTMHSVIFELAENHWGEWNTLILNTLESLDPSQSKQITIIC